jgi:hypothetical protein
VEWAHNNSKLSSDHKHYRCPSHCDESNLTSYVVVTGAKTSFPSSRSINRKAITDGTVNTILVIEIADSGIHWMEPRDLSISNLNFRVNQDPAHSISSVHQESGAYIATAAGFVNFLRAQTSEETIRSLLTIDGGEIIRDF